MSKNHAQTQSTQIITTLIISSPPFGQIDGKEGVDLGLVCAAFDHMVNLVFVDEGIFHLVELQNPTFFSDKLHDKQLKALEFYDIKTMYVETESLQKYSLGQSELLKNCQLINRQAINHMVKTSHHLVTF